MTAGKSRNGTVRNTDSFFRDDSVETRKITLTPNILRDESNGETIRSSERSRASSIDSIEKGSQSPERSKDDKKRKEKKTGMLSGLFKRRDKKERAKSIDDDGSDYEKAPSDTSHLQSKVSNETSPIESTSPSDFGSNSQSSRQSSRGKLQKVIRNDASLVKETRGHEGTEKEKPPSLDSSSTDPTTLANASLRMVKSVSEPSEQAKTASLARDPNVEPLFSSSASRKSLQGRPRVTTSPITHLEHDSETRRDEFGAVRESKVKAKSPADWPSEKELREPNTDSSTIGPLCAEL